MPDGRPGRNRSEAAWRAILAATRDELAAQGYDRLSIDRIATAAGVGKQTVYRWYRSKSALVAECILEGYVITPQIAVADTGDVRHDIRAWMQDFADGSRTVEGASLIRAGTAAAAEDDEVAARYQDAVAKVTQDVLASRLRRGVGLGQLPDHLVLETIAEAIVGALLYRILARREITPTFLDELIEVTLPTWPASRVF